MKKQDSWSSRLPNSTAVLFQGGRNLPPEEPSSLLFIKSTEKLNDSPFFSQLTEGINTGCRHAGFDLQISYFYEYKDRELQMKALKESGCRGIILLGTEISCEFFEPFSQLSTPMVVLDTYFEELDCDSILINNVQGAFRATSYLINNGLLKIGYLRSLYPIGNFAERADGYYKALRYHRVPSEHPYVHRLTPSVEGAYNDMKRLILDGIQIADGYFSDNDQIAAGAMRAFKEAGFRKRNMKNVEIMYGLQKVRRWHQLHLSEDRPSSEKKQRCVTVHLSAVTHW